LPGKRIHRVIVLFARRRYTDIAARLMGQWLSERLGQHQNLLVLRNPALVNFFDFRAIRHCEQM